MNDYFLVSAGIGVSVSAPDSFPPVRPQQPLAVVKPLELPFASILLNWLPTYPSYIWPRPPLPRAVFIGTDHAAVVEPAISPVVWLPRMPDWIARRTLPIALHPFYSLPPLGELLEIAARGSWRPQLPLPVRRIVRRQSAGAVYTIPPSVPAAERRCVDLVDDGVDIPTLDGAVDRPLMLDEIVSRSSFIDEELC